MSNGKGNLGQFYLYKSIRKRCYVLASGVLQKWIQFKTGHQIITNHIPLMIRIGSMAEIGSSGDTGVTGQTQRILVETVKGFLVYFQWE